MRGKRLSVLFVTLGFSLLGAVGAAHAVGLSSFELEPVNATCLPDAVGSVKVLNREEISGVDTLRLQVRGLPANTDFAVFLTAADAFAVPPFGATSYIGDFKTNAAGVGSLRVDAIIDEAFVSVPVGAPPVRTRFDVDHLVFWFADPAQVPACFNFAGATPFDGDANAGPAAMSSRGATGLEAHP